MDFTVVEKPSFMVIGIACRTCNESYEAMHDIPKLWEQFFKETCQGRIPNRISEEIVALYCDYEKDHTKPYTLIIGCGVPSLEVIPKGMVGKVVPASKYALFQAKGDQPRTLIDTWISIWQMDLERTYLGDFEIHHLDFGHNPRTIDVFVGIK